MLQVFNSSQVLDASSRHSLFKNVLSQFITAGAVTKAAKLQCRSLLRELRVSLKVFGRNGHDEVAAAVKDPQVTACVSVASC
jgi:hypothetical protein